MAPMTLFWKCFSNLDVDLDGWLSFDLLALHASASVVQLPKNINSTHHYLSELSETGKLGCI